MVDVDEPLVVTVREAVVQRGAARVGHGAVDERGHRGRRQDGRHQSTPKDSCGFHAGAAPVLVEAPAEVCAGEGQAVAAALAQARRGLDGLTREDRVVVGHPRRHEGLVDAAGRVEGHDVVVGVGDALEAVHPVADGDVGGRGVARVHAVVPRGLGLARLRQDRRVAVQPGLVAGVADRREVALLVRRRVGEQVEGLVGVRGDDGAVEGRRPPVAHEHVDAVVVPRHGGHRALLAHVGQALDEPVDVGRRPAGDGAPRGRPRHRQHAVVVEEPEEVTRRVGRRVEVAAGPDAGHERDREVAHEVVGEALVGEELAPCRVLRLVGEEGARRRVEARDVAEHPDEAGVGEAALLGEHALGTAPPGIRQAAPLARDAHAHLGGLGRHVELAEQAQQVRVGLLVVHDEAAVDAQAAVASGDVVGVRVSAEPCVALEEGDVVRRAEHVGGGQAGHAGADDGCGRSGRRGGSVRSSHRGLLADVVPCGSARSPDRMVPTVRVTEVASCVVHPSSTP